MPEIPPEWLRPADRRTRRLIHALYKAANEEGLITLGTFFWALSAYADHTLKRLFAAADGNPKFKEAGGDVLDHRFRDIEGQTMYLNVGSLMSIAESLRSPKRFEGIDLLAAFFQIIEKPNDDEFAKMALEHAGIDWKILEALVVDVRIDRSISEVDVMPPEKKDEFHLWIDPGDASPEVVGNVLAALSKLNRACGGSGLIFARDNSQQPLTICHA